MNPNLRIALRALIAFAGAFLASIYENRADGLSQEELISAAYAGWFVGSVYITVGVFTGLEPTLGIKSTAK